MRGSKAKRLRKFFPHSHEKSVWRKYKRLMTAEGTHQESTYKGPGVPVAKGKWLPSDEMAAAEQTQRRHVIGWDYALNGPIYANTALIELRPVYAIGSFFGKLNKAGKIQALIVSKLAEFISKPDTIRLIAHIKNNKEYFEPDRDESKQPQGPDRIGKTAATPVA